ncbi:hypothetical protein K461DRAFT_294899 [Myriangium duriaei CBS 260.36]|uniref:Uncharacterized protein n=1 Tax=Myriangium duriaei CBS 260.36 TaxID=1168546 RepID=A0A9P4J436_9PEZI|nr:hypothetical protein K461DRAFT_294899 [Myriangium duriaei CBS 260.36]
MAGGLWSKYTSLTPRTRILLGSSVILYALVAQTLTDAAEPVLGLQATPEDEKRVWGWLPRIRAVERRPDGSVDGGEREG